MPNPGESEWGDYADSFAEGMSQLGGLLSETESLASDATRDRATPDPTNEQVMSVDDPFAVNVYSPDPLQDIIDDAARTKGFNDDARAQRAQKSNYARDKQLEYKQRQDRVKDSDVDSAIDTVQFYLGNPTQLAQLSIASLPSSMAVMGATAVGGVAAGPAGAAGVASLAEGVLGGAEASMGTYQKAYDELIKQGVQPDDALVQAREAAQKAGLMGGAASAALGKFGEASLITRKFGSDIAVDAATDAATDAAKSSAIGRGTKALLGATAGEFAQGASVQIAENIAMDDLTPTGYFDGALNAGTIEALAAGPTSGATIALTKVMDAVAEINAAAPPTPTPNEARRNARRQADETQAGNAQAAAANRQPDPDIDGDPSVSADSDVPNQPTGGAPSSTTPPNTGGPAAASGSSEAATPAVSVSGEQPSTTTPDTTSTEGETGPAGESTGPVATGAGAESVVGDGIGGTSSEVPSAAGSSGQPSAASTPEQVTETRADGWTITRDTTTGKIIEAVPPSLTRDMAEDVPEEAAADDGVVSSDDLFDGPQVVEGVQDLEDGPGPLEGPGEPTVLDEGPDLAPESAQADPAPPVSGAAEAWVDMLEDVDSDGAIVPPAVAFNDLSEDLQQQWQQAVEDGYASVAKAEDLATMNQANRRRTGGRDTAKIGVKPPADIAAVLRSGALPEGASPEAVEYVASGLPMPMLVDGGTIQPGLPTKSVLKTAGLQGAAGSLNQAIKESRSNGQPLERGTYVIADPEAGVGYVMTRAGTVKGTIPFMATEINAPVSALDTPAGRIGYQRMEVAGRGFRRKKDAQDNYQYDGMVLPATMASTLQPNGTSFSGNVYLLKPAAAATPQAKRPNTFDGEVSPAMPLAAPAPGESDSAEISEVRDIIAPLTPGLRQLFPNLDNGDQATSPHDVVDALIAEAKERNIPFYVDVLTKIRPFLDGVTIGATTDVG